MRVFGRQERLDAPGPRADKPKEYEPASTIQQSAPPRLHFGVRAIFPPNRPNSGQLANSEQLSSVTRMRQIVCREVRMIRDAGYWTAMERDVMNLSLVDAFGRFGAKPANRLRGQSAIAADGALVLSCSHSRFGHPAQGVLRYEGKLTKEGEEASANDLLGQHLTLARDGDLPVRMVVMTSLVDASTSKVSRSFHVRPDLIGKLVSFDGDSYTVDFTRVSEDGVPAAPARRTK